MKSQYKYVSHKQKLLDELRHYNPVLIKGLNKAICNSYSSPNRDDTIFITHIQHLLILYINNENSNYHKIFANLKQNQEDFENTFLHKIKDKKQRTEYYLNIDLNGRKIYYSREFLNEKNQITTDIFEIEFTNLGKKILEKNFTILYHECATFTQHSKSKSPSLLKFPIPFTIVHGKATLVEKRNAQNSCDSSNHNLDHNLENISFDNHKLNSAIEQFLKTFCTTESAKTDDQNTDKRIVKLEQTNNKRIIEPREADDPDTNITSKKRKYNDEMKINKTTPKIIQFSNRGSGIWI